MIEAAGYLEEIVFRRLVAPDDVAAVIVEPVLGEGGYVVPPADWLRRLRTLCDRHGILLIADEVQTGAGRTGAMWAVEHFEIERDILVSAKGLASGMPLGAVVARPEIMTWPVGAHGSTFGGNPVSCAAALATLDLLETGLIDNARRVGTLLLEHLIAAHERTKTIRAIRGLGLMIGVDFADGETADAVQAACFERGLLVLRAGDRSIRVSPPLVIRAEQARAGAELFAQVCESV